MDAALETKRAWPFIGIVTLVGFGAITIFLSFSVVPKFEQIYKDAFLPGTPLPEITVFIIAARIPLTLIALAWPMAEILAVWQRWRAAKWIIPLGYLYFFLLIVVTVFALFMPMNEGIITGMSDTSTTGATSSH